MVEKLKEILEMIEDMESDSVYDLACQIRVDGRRYRLPIAVSYSLIPSMLEEDE